MSCEIKLIYRLSNPERIIRHLFNVDNSREFPENWLQSCLVSVCPTGKTVVIARKKRIVVLKLVNTQFDIYYVGGDIHDEERIKAVTCLPFTKEDSRNKLQVEWTCLAVGYDSGFVKFYTNDFILLYSQQFHEEEVCSIKCQSKLSPRPDINYDHRLEEIFVHYSSAVCKISGERLFSVLGLCYAKSLEGAFEAQTANIFNDTSFTKWGYENQFCVNDGSVVGLTLTNTFDHLMAVATYDGFNASYRITPPIRHSVVAVGSKPALGFHCAAEYEQHVFFADVAKAVASKFKSALPSWFSGKQPSVEKNTLAVQTAQAMDCRFGIHDLRRTATSIILSQNRRLALTADVLGRVLLVDTHRGIVLHIFKGYRDAQCAFMQVKEEEREDKRGLERIATFIVIYSPKKGTLEIFCAQKVKKIAVFKVSKFSVLLYISHGLVGVTNITAAKKYICPFNCILIDPDGNINDIKIPFYFALPEKDSKKARDIFLYKRLKYFVKTAKYNLNDLTEKVLKVASEIEFIDVHIECLKMLIQQDAVHSDTILKFTDYLLEKYYPETEEIEDSVKCHKSFIVNLKKLSSLYVFLTSYTPITGKACKETPALSVKEAQLNRLQNLLDLLTAYQEDSPVRNDASHNFYEFLSVFELNDFEKLKLKSDLKSDVLVRISNLFFSPYLFDERDDFLEFCTVVTENKFCVRNLFEMLLHCWLHQKLTKDTNLMKVMANFSEVMMRLLQNMDDRYDIKVGFNLRSEFWQEFREILAGSSHPFLALCAAFACSSVSIKLDESDSSIDEEFVQLTNEMCHWDGLTAKLDQMALLNVILSNKFRFNEKYCKLPKLRNEDLKFSLKSMEEKGKGAVSEIVAKWLTNSGVNPDYVAINHYYYMKKLEVKEDGDEEDEESEEEIDDEFRSTRILTDSKELEWVFCQFNILAEHFHLSLNPDVVLLNMSWEYANAWKNQIQEITYLETALNCVRYIKTMLLKEGLLCLIWDTFLKIKFVNVCKVLNIVGQLPNQMLCVRETELTDLQIKNFLAITSTFLKNLMYLVRKRQCTEETETEFSINLRGEASSLAELAFERGGLYIPLVYVHFQLSRSLELMITYTFKKKFIKPIEDLFDPEIVETFYVDFHQTPALRSEPDTKTQKARRKFLIKIIVASARAIPDGESEAHINQHLEFTEKCIELAEMWNLDIFEYKRLQVMELYIKGCDHQAYRLINLIPYLDKSGVDMLNIAAKRMYMIIMDSANPIGNQTCLSVDLSRYMKEVLIEKKDWCARGSLGSVKFLATHAYRSFQEGSYQRKLSQHLLEAVENFERVEESNAQLLIDKKREREEALKKLGY